MKMNADELKAVIANHGKWLRNEPGGVRAYLTGADLRDAHLTRADLTRANLTRADLRDANLRGADLPRAYLTGADLTGADLTRANLRDAHLTGADLRDADLRGADLTRAYLRGADLTGAHLTGADLTRANLTGADLPRAYLTGADLTRAYLRGADLTRAYLAGANLTGAYLAGTCLDERIHNKQREFCRACSPNKHGGRIVYRMATSHHVSSTEYTPGHTYIAPHLSFDCATACHPGIYAASLEWMLQEYPTAPLVRCYVRDGDWVISAKGAIRCKRLRVLNFVEGG